MNYRNRRYGLFQLAVSRCMAYPQKEIRNDHRMTKRDKKVWKRTIQ